ncbi:hypothetical protein TM239_68480 [Bradyrhizobium sp. TM239]|nr:hypothetical protein TM239_68480 [Bradyrhizobium sp. TM239]
MPKNAAGTIGGLNPLLMVPPKPYQHSCATEAAIVTAARIGMIRQALIGKRISRVTLQSWMAGRDAMLFDKRASIFGS